MNNKVRCHKKKINRFSVMEYFDKTELPCKTCIFYKVCLVKQQNLDIFNKD